jgi:hypothetical protein
MSAICGVEDADLVLQLLVLQLLGIQPLGLQPLV